MHWSRIFSIVGSIALLAAMAEAQTDPSGPKAAMKSLYSAVARADAASIQKLMVVENDSSQQLVKAYADLIVAGKKLADTAKERYPGAVGAFAQGTILPEDEHLINTANVTIEGDRAVLKMSGRIQTITLRRNNGAWQMVVASGEPTPERREQQLALLSGMTEVMTKAATEISEGQFNTIQDAEAAVKERLGAVLAKALQKATPSTQPATREAVR